MNNIYVYDINYFELLGVIDSYVSCIWRPAYYDIGDFELYLGASQKTLELLQVNRLLIRDCDIVNDNGIITYRNIMMIKSIDLTTNIEKGDFLIVKGKELKYLLHQRVILEQTNLNTTVENAIRQLVYDNCIDTGQRIERVIPHLYLGEEIGITDTVDKQVSNGYLDEVVIDMCRAINLGWEIIAYDGGYYTLRLYKGVDRSYNQSERPYVVFSDDFENLFNTEYQIESANYANVAYIAGEGEGINRKSQIVGANGEEPTLIIGYDRYEMYVDARDISSNNGAIPTATYNQKLRERADEKLAAVAITEGFSGEVLTTGRYKYNVDFSIGDMVTVINSYGIMKNVMVLSSIEAENENGYSLIPQFNI